MIDYRAMGRPRTRRIAAVIAFCGALAAAGCGGNGDEQRASDVAQAYVEASNQGDATEVCDLYSDRLKQQLAIGASCEEFVKEQTSGAKSTLELTGVQEQGDRATAKLQATVAEGPKSEIPLEIQLQRQDGEWLISGLGAAGVAPSD
jgi:ketosteroid isomerase-like protein